MTGQLKIAFTFSLLLLLVLGQNCSPQHENLLESASTGKLSPEDVYQIEDGIPLYSVYPAESLGKDMDLTFLAFASELSAEGKNLLWDNSMPGGQFCNQTGGNNPYEVIVNCPQTGMLTLSLVIESSDGTVVVHEVNVEILEGAKPPPDPVMPDEPPKLTGQQLYQNYCIGCHGVGTKNGRSAAQIKVAIDGNIGGMGNLRSLNSEELNLIADYMDQ